LEKTPDDIDCLYNYGLALAKMEKYEAADVQYQKALKLDPDNINVLFVHGLTLEQLEKYDYAIKQLKRALAKSSSKDVNNLIHLNLGCIYYRKGSQNEGDRYLQMAIEGSHQKDSQRIEMAKRIFPYEPEKSLLLLQDISQSSPYYRIAFEWLSSEFLGSIKAKSEETKRLEEYIEKLEGEVGKFSTPMVYVEGKTDEEILNTAWEKIYDSTRMPFTIKNCDVLSGWNHGGAGGVQTLVKLLSVVREDSPFPVIGIFDRDRAGMDGYESNKGLPRYFSEIEGLEAKMAIHRKAAAFLLPIPIGRENYAENCNLCIEFFFSEKALSEKTSENRGLNFRYPKAKLVVKGRIIRETETTEAELREIADDSGKTIFATQIVPKLDKT